MAAPMGLHLVEKSPARRISVAAGSVLGDVSKVGANRMPASLPTRSHLARAASTSPLHSWARLSIRGTAARHMACQCQEIFPDNAQETSLVAEKLTEAVGTPV
jgi:hypothetical protein